MPLIKGKSDKAFKENVRTEMHAGKPQKQSLAIAYAMKRKAKKYADGGEVEDDSDKDSLAKTASNFFSRMANPQPSPAPDKYAQVRDQNKKNMGYSIGGEVHKPGSLLDEESIEREIMQDETSHMTRLRPTQFNRAHVASNGPAMREDAEGFNQHAVGTKEDRYDDLVDRIMERRSMDYSGLARLAKGGYLEDGEMYPHSKNGMFDTTNKYSLGGRVANETPIVAGFMPNEFDDLVLRDDLESTYGDDDNAGDSLDNAQENKDRKDIVSRIMASRKKKDRLPNPR